jgi:glycosyltransferase involved in cell wall biosynthesis
MRGMGNRKTLSVIIAAYDMEAYLPRCLESLVVSDARLLSRLEVLVVNDGSKDRTSEVAHAFAAKHPGVVRVIDKENANYGSCVNRGLDEATGVFVKCLDADDWFDTKVFEKYLAFVEPLAARADGPDLIVNDYAMVDAEDRARRRVPHPDFSIPEMARLVAASPLSFAMHAVAYRLDRVRALGYRQTEGISYTDNEWALCPMANVRSCARFDGGALYRYCIGREGQSVSDVAYLKNFWMYLDVVARMLQWHAVHRSEFATDNAHYLRVRIALDVYWVYRTWLVNASLPRIGADDIARLDEAMERDVPDVDAAFREFGRARRWVRAYVRLWRTHRANPLVKFLDRIFRRLFRTIRPSL